MPNYSLLVSHDVSKDISSKRSESNLTSRYALSSSSQTCKNSKNEHNKTITLRSSKSIAPTILPILNKTLHSNTMCLSSPINVTSPPSSYKDFTLKNFNLPSLSSKYSAYSSSEYCRNMASFDNSFIKSIASYHRTWPLAGKDCPGFKPLGYRRRPTVGEQCLKTGVQWSGPREQSGPSLPYLDLFADYPTVGKGCEPVKNNFATKPVKQVSSLRKNRFPTVLDIRNNIRKDFLTFDEGLHRTIGEFAQGDSSLLPSVDFPEVTSCKLNKVVNQKRDRSNELYDPSKQDCSECLLCRNEVELKAHDAHDVSMIEKNSTKYHIRLPTID